MNQKSAAAALVHVQAELIKSGNMKTNQFKVLTQVFFKVSMISSALLPRDKEQAPPSGSCDRRGHMTQDCRQPPGGGGGNGFLTSFYKLTFACLCVTKCRKYPAAAGLNRTYLNPGETAPQLPDFSQTQYGSRADRQLLQTQRRQPVRNRHDDCRKARSREETCTIKQPSNEIIKTTTNTKPPPRHGGGGLVFVVVLWPRSDFISEIIAI